MAQLQSGTRIYGTANVDFQINLGANAYLSTNALLISNGTTSNVTANSSVLLIQSNTTVNTFINSTAISVKGVVANNTFGTAGYVLYSNGTGSYWAAAAGGFTNGQSISVNTFQFAGQVIANGFTGSAGALLVGNSTGGVYFDTSTYVSNNYYSSTSSGVSNSYSTETYVSNNYAITGVRFANVNVQGSLTQGLPTTTANGALWLDTDTGILSTFYGANNVWVAVSSQNFKGPNGDPGTTGFTGSVGYTGSIGSIGFQGSAGTPGGAQGYTGSAGTNGYSGSAGAAGFTTYDYGIVYSIRSILG